jgi:DNA invertase Pin-like site-specific DNA recombinase
MTPAQPFHAGLNRARAQGRRLGRPTIEADKAAAITAALRAGGAGLHKIAKAHGVGVSTVQRLKAELADA